MISSIFSIKHFQLFFFNISDYRMHSTILVILPRAVSASCFMLFSKLFFMFPIWSSAKESFLFKEVVFTFEKKKSYLKNSLLNSLQLYPTFPSSIGLSLMWTIGPGWDLDDLNNKQIQLKEKKYLSKIAFHKIITSNIKKSRYLCTLTAKQDYPYYAN